jgi:alkanesulfonate monooxygenase SsuD/methylene tetrahydromethanopterin reductase-like flavin-dependent oxidoreductase (luciferase family)
MARLEFGYWDAVPGYSEDYPGAVADIYDEHLRLAQRIEEMGWHSYYVIEHQNGDVSRITAPSVWLTAVARETSRLRIGAMMYQLPLHHPIRLAQEVAMLDQLSRGRVEFSTGIGVREHEFMRWGVNFYERAAMAEEVMQIVKMAWTQDEVTFDGKYWHFDEALPQPKPYQKPYPPIWAAVHSDAACEWAARNNLNVSQNLDTDETVKRKFDIFRSVWKECGHPSPMPRTFLHRPVHVAETDEKAHEEARPSVASRAGIPDAGPVANVRMTGRLVGSRIGLGTHARGMGADSERVDNKERGLTMDRATRDYDFSLESGLAIVGSPETVIRRIQEQQAYIGYDILTTAHGIGRMPPEMVQNSVELFGREVIPAFR